MLRTFSAVAGVAAVLLASPDARPEPERGANVISVEVRSLHSQRGQVLCFLYASASGFPQEPAAAISRTTAPVSSKGATCRFDGVRPGAYAVAVVHDEKGTGRLERNFMGIPTDGVGASNDPISHFGPPKFQDARFLYGGGPTTLIVHVHYLM